MDKVPAAAKNTNPVETSREADTVLEPCSLRLVARLGHVPAGVQNCLCKESCLIRVSPLQECPVT
jgi:hypothetical protein